jgi:hypothetical protein
MFKRKPSLGKLTFYVVSKIIKLELTDDLIPLIDVIGAREEDSAANHFSHDAAHGPDVHVLLVAHAQDDFRRSVIPGDDVGRHHEGRAGGSRQSEVENLQSAIRTDHDIAWLEILKKKYLKK